MRHLHRLTRALLALAIPLTAGCSSGPRLSTVELPGRPLKAGARGHIVIGPYVQPDERDLSRSMRIVWWSDAPGSGRLEFTGSGNESTVDVPSEQVAYEGLVRHEAALNRDAANGSSVQVLATVNVGGKRYTSEPVTVPWAPGRGQAFRFVALGDEGAGTPSERRIADLVAGQKPQAIILTGDDVYDRGDWSEYRARLFPYYGRLMATVPILPALGNHDVGNPAHMGEPFRMAWAPPLDWHPPAGAKGPYSLLRRRSNKSQGPVPAGQWTERNYSVDAGNCHFLCLDSTADHDTMRDMIVPWARQDLAEAKRRGQTWLIAYWHHPPYTRGGYRDNSGQWSDIRELYVPVLREAGAQVLLNGHDHGYQHMRKDGIDCIITAAGGAKLYPVHPEYSANEQPPLLAWNDKDHSFTVFDQSADGKTLNVRQIDEYGKQIDAFQLTAR